MTRRIFVSYSHANEKWLERLQVHLKRLESDGLVEVWDDTRISSGQKWKSEIKTAIDSAAVAILLVSADFLASDFIKNNELPPLLSAAEVKGTAILPLIVSPCGFSDARFLRSDEAKKYLNRKRQATFRFVENFRNKLIEGSKFKMKTISGERTKVYSLEYDRFLNSPSAI